MCSVANCVPLLIQQNDGSGAFSRSWAEFKVGFNDLRGNYWLGNDLLSQLTASGRFHLRFDVQSLNTSIWYYAEYTRFVVQSEAENYRMQVGGYSGNVGYDAFGSVYHNNMMFTTHDRDNDRWSGNCAVGSGGGFWYGSCRHCGVNGAHESLHRFNWGRLPGGGRLRLFRMWLQC